MWAKENKQKGNPLQSVSSRRYVTECTEMNETIKTDDAVGISKTYLLYSN